MNPHRVYQAIPPYFRRKRMQWFLELLHVQLEDRLLDVGGHPESWSQAAGSAPVTLFNLGYPADIGTTHPGFTYVTGDAGALPFANREFDVVFSNSAIEHAGTWERQVAFAAEVQRVGRKFWVQTPAYEFFIEPHLLAPFIHWLPVRWQRRFIRNFTWWGWLVRPPAPDVDAFLAEVRLLTRPEMRKLFPDCRILEEKFLGMTKSYIAVRDR
jgi:hypothetical protein